MCCTDYQSRDWRGIGPWNAEGIFDGAGQVYARGQDDDQTAGEARVDEPECHGQEDDEEGV